MFNDYPSPAAAFVGLVDNGLQGMTVEITPVLGGRFQPVVICEFEADLQRCQNLGFNARLRNDYPYG